MAEHTIIKKLFDEMVDTIEDLATLLLTIGIAVFAAGAYYGSIYAHSPALWYPGYLVVAILVLKLLKDLLVRATKKG